MAVGILLASTSLAAGVLLATASLAAAQDPDLADPRTAAPGEELSDSLSVSVEEATICLRVDKENREPVGAGDRFPADVGNLTCFTRIKGGSGGKIVHAWIHEGHTRARVTLEIGSDSWRTWSTKRILPSWTGRWEVKVMTPDGVVLKSIPFTVY